MKERIATVGSTGERYIVQQIDFRTGTCHCWGDVVAFEFRKGKLLKRDHDKSVSFPVSSVRIEDVDLTPDTMSALFEQTKRHFRPAIESGKMQVHEPRRRGPRA